jgi:hypothetical protein
MKVVVTFPIPDVAKQLISEHAVLQCWESEESIPNSTLIDWATVCRRTIELHGLQHCLVRQRTHGAVFGHLVVYGRAKI